MPAAIAAVDKKTYDLVLADIRLGDGDGFDILAHCRKNQPGTHRDPDHRLRHRRNGASRRFAPAPSTC